MTGRAGRPTRRSFLRALAGESLCFVDELRGRPQMRLADLPAVPEHVLATMVPVLAPGLLLDRHRLLRGPGPGREPVAVRSLGADERAVVAAFDGRSSVQEVADGVAARLGLDDEDALSLVLRVFLDLARDALAGPSGAHDHHRGPSG